MIKATPAKIRVKFKIKDLMFISFANNLRYPDPIDLLRQDVSSWHLAASPNAGSAMPPTTGFVATKMLTPIDPPNADTFLHCATREKTWPT
jgi:hypothetical protein